MPGTPPDRPAVNRRDEPDPSPGGGDAGPPDPAEEARRSLSPSFYLWTAIVAALFAAVFGFLVRPFRAFFSLKAAVSPREVAIGLKRLRGSGPVGTELARRFLAGRFRADPAGTAVIIAREQVLFRGLPAKTFAGYFGPPQTFDKKTLRYLVGREDGALLFLVVRLREKVVDGIYLDRVPAPDAPPAPGRAARSAGGPGKPAGPPAPP